MEISAHRLMDPSAFRGSVSDDPVIRSHNDPIRRAVTCDEHAAKRNEPRPARKIGQGRLPNPIVTHFPTSVIGGSERQDEGHNCDKGHAPTFDPVAHTPSYRLLEGLGEKMNQLVDCGSRTSKCEIRKSKFANHPINRSPDGPMTRWIIHAPQAKAAKESGGPARYCPNSGRNAGFQPAPEPPRWRRYAQIRTAPPASGNCHGAMIPIESAVEQNVHVRCSPFRAQR